MVNYLKWHRWATCHAQKPANWMSRAEPGPAHELILPFASESICNTELSGTSGFITGGRRPRARPRPPPTHSAVDSNTIGCESASMHCLRSPMPRDGESEVWFKHPMKHDDRDEREDMVMQWALNDGLKVASVAPQTSCSNGCLYVYIP